MSEKKTCHTCRHILVLDRPYCAAHPPTCFLVPAAGVMGPQTVSSYTPINPQQPCGEHRAKAVDHGDIVQIGQNWMVKRDAIDRGQLGYVEPLEGEYHRHIFKIGHADEFLYCTICHRIPDGLLARTATQQRDPGDEDGKPCA